MDGVAFFFDTPTDNHTRVENGVELCEMTDRKCGQKVVTECKILAKKNPSSQKHTHANRYVGTLHQMELEHFSMRLHFWLLFDIFRKWYVMAVSI